jgi:hypothetical protein
VNRVFTRLLQAAALGLLLSGMIDLRADEVVRIHVPSNILTDRSDLVVQVLVVRNTENRAVRVTAESASYYGSSEIQIDGDRHPTVQLVRFVSVPAGWYEVTGTVFDQRAKSRGAARTSVLVYPR